MSGLWQSLKDRIAVLSDPHAKTLRGPSFASVLKAKPTQYALDALRADSATLEEMTQRDEATRRAVAERRRAAAALALDRGEKAPEPEDDAQAPEWRSTLDRLNTIAAELGLPSREHIRDHLSARRSVLVDHLVERYRLEGEPAELVRLRGEAAKLTQEGWELQHEQREQQKGFRAFGGASNGANVEREAALMTINDRVRANGAALMAVRRRLSLEFGIDR